MATGKYVALINNDTILIENSFKTMFKWLEGHHNIGAGSCLLLDNEHKISPIMSVGYFPELRDLLGWAFFLDDLPVTIRFFKPFHIHTNLYKSSEEFLPDWISGSFMFIRKEVLDKVGGMDESIFMYGEDVDLCYRIKLAGWKVGYNPATQAIHIGQASQKGMPRGYILGEFTGLKYFYAKHFPQWKQAILDFLLDIAAFNRIVLWLVRLKPELAKIYLEALFV